MKKHLINNCKGSHYRVNENVPFEQDWFLYLNCSPLPWYYRIVPVVADFGDYISKLPELIHQLSSEFAYVHIEKYLTKSRVVITLVTNKSILSIDEILRSISLCKLIY